MFGEVGFFLLIDNFKVFFIGDVFGCRGDEDIAGQVGLVGMQGVSNVNIENWGFVFFVKLGDMRGQGVFFKKFYVGQTREECKLVV